MAASSYSVVGVHTSSIYPAVQEHTVQLSTSYNHSVISAPNTSQSQDIPPEHATNAFVLYDPLVNVLLRVLHDRRTIELISLGNDAPAIRFSFPSPVLPSPVLVFNEPELHVVACTVTGSLYRLIFTLPNLWLSPSTNDWQTEYRVQHATDNLLGPVHANEDGDIFIGLRDGNLLRIDTGRGTQKYVSRGSCVRIASYSIQLMTLRVGRLERIDNATSCLHFVVLIESIPEPSSTRLITHYFLR
jgi:hypothetical protein